MSKKVSLDKRWKEVVFAGAGFGPNLLMVVMMAYFTDAIMPGGLDVDINFWSYSGQNIVLLAIFPILWFFGRAFDGIIDVPLAALTDSLKNKKGKRFITILISFVPMVVSFILAWIPICGTKDLSTGQLVGNSIWIMFWSLVFFAAYTLALITFYGSLSEVCTNQTQRARVSAYKSVFDTITYALGYAAIPAIFKAVNIPIYQVVLYLSPLMLTILIPYLFRQNGTEVLPEEDKNVNIGKSIAMTVKSKPFMKWTIVNCVAFFGLQMFLVAQNTLISGVMKLDVFGATIMNTCAFAPVPLMLFLFNKIRKKKGIRFAYQLCLITFALGILSFDIGSRYFFESTTTRMIIGMVGGVIGSFGIGGFFMVPYLIPTVIASVEEEVMHKNHSAMYFAVQALATSIVGAVASSLVYNYIKNWEVQVSEELTWKCGVSLVPLIVLVFCVAGFFCCFLMPKRYNAKDIYNDYVSSATKAKAKLLKNIEHKNSVFAAKIAKVEASSLEQNEKEVLIASLKFKQEQVITKLEAKVAAQDEILSIEFDETKSSANEESYTAYEKSSYVADVCLYFLSVSIYGLVSYFGRLAKLNKLGIKTRTVFKVFYIAGAFVPFIAIVTNALLEKYLAKYAQRSPRYALVIISSFFLPLFTNFIDLVEKDCLFNHALTTYDANLKLAE